MDFNKRIEFTCGKCGKTRILSPKEASEDGWRINSENGKIECYQCLPKYGIPTTFLRVPKDELRRRLENRIDKPSEKEITLRLNRFDYEESRIDLYDYVLKNDDLEKTVQIIMTIIDNEYKLNNK